MAAKNMPAITETTESPPRIKPTSESAKPTRRSLTLPWAIKSPARMNIGMATRAKELMPWNICWVTTISGTPD